MEQVFKDAIKKYGRLKQVLKAIEELSELQQALAKNLNGVDNTKNLIEEIADVSIMIDQLKEIYKIEDYRLRYARKAKADRLRRVMESETR